jgi:uncharacterized membrane protein
MTNTIVRRPAPASRIARIIALAVGAFYVAVGTWAFVGPTVFYADVAPFPPYNQHLFHDLGAFQVGLGLALIVGAMVRGGLLTALLAVLAASLLHVASHVEDRSLGGRSTDLVFLSLLCVALAAAAVLEYRAEVGAVGTSGR